MKTEQDEKNFAALLRAEEEMGGYHVQFNVVSKKTLLAAQETPDDYRDLLVRVAGYSAFFTDLRPEAQEGIIVRTEQESW